MNLTLQDGSLEQPISCYFQEEEIARRAYYIARQNLPTVVRLEKLTGNHQICDIMLDMSLEINEHIYTYTDHEIALFNYYYVFEVWLVQL